MQHWEQLNVRSFAVGETSIYLMMARFRWLL